MNNLGICLKVSYCCDIGNLREKNEDGILVFEKFFRNCSGYVEKHIFEFPAFLAVADGVGSEHFGEIASEYILKSIGSKTPKSKQELEQALIQSKKDFEYFFEQKVSSDKAYKNCSTTLAGVAFLSDTKALIFNVGDSRVYRYRDGYILRLSKDHSFVEMLIDAGEISYQEARTHPKRNVITSCISADSCQDFQIFFKEISIFKDDIFLICTDGFWEQVTEEQMEEIMKTQKDFNNISQNMVSLVKPTAKDNISLIVFKVC